MLLLDDPWCSVENTEGRLALSGVIGDAKLEKDSEQLRPVLICWPVSDAPGEYFVSWPYHGTEGGVQM